MNYSENNLVHPMNVIDRINSTSSSNESVCSTSSLNHSYTRQQMQSSVPSSNALSASQVPSVKSVPGYIDNNKTNNYSLRNDDTSQNYMPKKTQRSKEVSRQRFHSPRDNV